MVFQVPLLLEPTRRTVANTAVPGGGQALVTRSPRLGWPRREDETSLSSTNRDRVVMVTLSSFALPRRQRPALHSDEKAIRRSAFLGLPVLEICKGCAARRLDPELATQLSRPCYFPMQERWSGAAKQPLTYLSALGPPGPERNPSALRSIKSNPWGNHNLNRRPLGAGKTDWPLTPLRLPLEPTLRPERDPSPTTDCRNDSQSYRAKYVSVHLRSMRVVSSGVTVQNCDPSSPNSRLTRVYIRGSSIPPSVLCWKRELPVACASWSVPNGKDGQAVHFRRRGSWEESAPARVGTAGGSCVCQEPSPFDSGDRYAPQVPDGKLQP